MTTKKQLWDEKFATGVKQIDKQHQRLMELINDLQDANEKSTPEEDIKRVLGQLVEYTKTHFAQEEALMRANGFPDFERHKLLHAKLVTKLNDFNESFRINGKQVLTELQVFLQTWLSVHIQAADQRYSPFLNPNKGG